MGDGFQPVKAIIVGDGATGKTALTVRMINDSFTETYQPTTVIDYNRTVSHQDGKQYNVTIFDTAGQEGYEFLRGRYYEDAEVVVLVFAVASVDNTHYASLKNAKSTWMEEIRQNTSGRKLPIVLVGTKVDLREENDKDHVNNNEGKKAAQSLKAHSYVECSAKTNESKFSCQNVMTAIIEAKLKPNQTMKPDSCCNVL